MRAATLLRFGIAALVIVACEPGYWAQSGQAMMPPNSATPTSAVQPANDGSRPALQRRNPRYEIGVGDTLSLEFPIAPEFNQTVLVQPDGYVTLNGVGDLHVAGETVPQFTEAVRQAYTKILHDPVINVDLKDFQKPFFTVFGEVGRPGQFDLRGDITVSQAVAIAGGFTSASKHSQVLLFRRVSDNWSEVKKLDLKHMLSAGNLSEDMHLMPGDIIFVPKNFISKIKEPFVPTPSVMLPTTPKAW